jgi:hypothetical protein
MTEREKKDKTGLAQLAELQPPEWILEMQRYYRQHGAYRAQDVARLLGQGVRAEGTLAQTSTQATIELLQQAASKRK